MPGIKFQSNPSNGGYPVVQEYVLGNSQTIRSQDLVVLVSSTTASIFVRAGTDADSSTASWTESATLKGCLGVAMHDAATNSTGQATTQITPPGSGAPVDYPIYQLPSYSAGLGKEPATGRSMLLVALFNETNIFRAAIVSNLSAVTINQNNTIGQTYGLQYNRTGATNTWRIDEAQVAGNQALAVMQFVAANDPTYNTSSLTTQVEFKVKAAWQQINNGQFWTA